MSGTDIDVVYWDTCIFYAFLKGEKHRDGEHEGIIEEYNMMRDGKLRIITSSITVAEVAKGKFKGNESKFEEFKSLRFSGTFEFVIPSLPVCDVASEIKDYYYNNPVGEQEKHRLVSLGDAMHLATAIVHGASCMVTTDGKHVSDIGLLKLSQPIAGKYSLLIRRPKPPAQQGLDL